MDSSIPRVQCLYLRLLYGICVCYTVFYEQVVSTIMPHRTPYSVGHILVFRIDEIRWITGFNMIYPEWRRVQEIDIVSFPKGQIRWRGRGTSRMKG